MAKRSVGISGAALMFVGAGAWLVYSGVRDVAPVSGLREILKGREPQGASGRLSLIGTAGGSAGTSGSAGPATGSLVRIPGTGITVDSSIASNVTNLIRDARAAGISLDGSGYRTSLRQAQLRIQNGCTCSDSSKCCKVPTAPVGQSMHEKGLAIDFTQNGRILQTPNTGYAWLARNASKYGLRNLPSEPWHWSTNGR